ncbi:MAG: hypothetical protein J1F04_08295 [Oscillospiraceae bacterium]|nr:hypothetical protein [Oscillospiraceae bacterium]
MKRITQIISVISLIIAAVALIFNFQVLSGKSYFIRFAVFSTIRRGDMMGFLGNLLGLLITSFAFAAMGVYGAMLSIFNREKARKPALISGICVTVLALISLFFSFNNNFNIGDIFIILFPAAFTFCVIQTTDIK